MGRTKYEPPVPGRTFTIMSNEDREKGKKSCWPELSIGGSGVHVKKIAPEIFSYKQLTAIHFQDNKIERIPPEIVQLPLLQYLNFDNNRISVIPDEICDMVELRFLSFKNNKLSAIPQEIGRLFQLTTFNLEGNVGLPMDIISATKSGLSGFLQFMLERLNCKYVMAVVVTTAACLLWLPSSVKYQQQYLLLTKSTSTEPQKFILSTLILMCVRCV